jgi:battenin
MFDNSSGLGELTFLQLSTTYAPSSVAGRSLGYVFYHFLPATPHKIDLDDFHEFRHFASGTGAAGLVGAFLWWEVRGMGVRTGVGLSAVCILPSFHNSLQ